VGAGEVEEELRREAAGHDEDDEDAGDDEGEEEGGQDEAGEAVGDAGAFLFGGQGLACGGDLGAAGVAREGPVGVTLGLGVLDISHLLGPAHGSDFAATMHLGSWRHV